MDIATLIDLAPVWQPTTAGGQPAEAQVPLVPFSLGCEEKVEHGKALGHRPGEGEQGEEIEPALLFGSAVQVIALPRDSVEPKSIQVPSYPPVREGEVEHCAGVADPARSDVVTASSPAPAAVPEVPFTALGEAMETGAALICALTVPPYLSAETATAEPPSVARGAPTTVRGPPTQERVFPPVSHPTTARAEPSGSPEPRDETSPVRLGDSGRARSGAATMEQQPVPASGVVTPAVDRPSQRDVVQGLQTEPLVEDGGGPDTSSGGQMAARTMSATAGDQPGNPAPVPPGGLQTAPSGGTVSEPLPLIEAEPGFGRDSGTPESFVANRKRGFGPRDRLVAGEGSGSPGIARAPDERAEVFTRSLPTDALPVHVSPSHGDTTLRADIPATTRAEVPAPPPVARQLAEAFAAFPDRPVEITLSPEELGRVRMVVTSADGTLVLSLAAERPETLDLMRRHIDQLATDLRDLGFGSFRFTFAGDGTGREDARPAPFADAPSPHEPAPAEPAPAPRAVRPASAGAGLDIRL